MNKVEEDRIHELCSLIADEQDPEKFKKLVEELNGILSAKDDRLQNTKTEEEKH